MFKHLGIQLKLHEHSNEQKDVAKPSKGERKFKRVREEKRGSEKEGVQDISCTFIVSLAHVK